MGGGDGEEIRRGAGLKKKVGGVTEWEGLQKGGGAMKLGVKREWEELPKGAGL